VCLCAICLWFVLVQVSTLNWSVNSVSVLLGERGKENKTKNPGYITLGFLISYSSCCFKLQGLMNQEVASVLRGISSVVCSDCVLEGNNIGIHILIFLF
jgi:hypothetical protein